MEYPFKDLLPLDEVLEREGYYKDWTHLDPEVFYSLTQISEYIKTKGYGVDVRLLIAQLAEHFGLKTTQVVDLANLLQDKFSNLEGVTRSFTNNINSLVAQMEADKDAVIANATVDSEVILSRGDFDTLGERLNDTALQLDHLQSIESANSSNILSFSNYLGNAQNIHPKVISFTQPWNGYKYWMAFTPYPKGDTDAENPSVRASNNLVDWVLPSGMADPIDPTPPVGYNSDTHILYRPDLDRLEVWWRQVRNETNDIAIIREVSKDGINWTNKQTMHQAQNTSEDMLSPSIIFEDGLYKVWYCARGSQGVKCAEMNPDATWNFKSQHVPIEWGNLSPWHLDVIHTDLGYEMVINAYDRVTESVSALDLYYVLVDDNNVASKPHKVIARSNDPNAIDFKSIYRSSILKEGGKYYIFYSSIDRENNRWMSLSFGESPFGLTGLKGQKFKEAQELRINAGSNLVDLDVSGVDNLVISGGAEVTLNSLKGGYLGKKITIYLYALNARVYVQSSARIRLPANKSFVMEYTYHPTLDLMCTSPDGREWRVLNNTAKTSSVSVNVSASGNPTLSDYDISGVSVLRVTGAGTLTVESFKPTHTGQILYVVLASSAKVKFIDSPGKIRTPGLTEYELDISKMGVTVICTDASIGECRVIG